MTSPSQQQFRRLHLSGSLPNLQKNLGIPEQQSLSFYRAAEETSFDDDSMVRSAITETIRASSKSRDQIAEEMSYLLGKRITTQMLNDFTSDAKKLNRWPAAWDRAFCRVTGNDSLLICRVVKAGYYVINETEAELLELGREFLKQKRSSEKVALLEKRLAGVEL